MREPASQNVLNPAVPDGSEPPALSIPDRRRIDSDVRAFLREPSTPWIVFDREGRPPSQLAVGEVLPVAFTSVIPEHGFFPAPPGVTITDLPAIGGSDPGLEPSSLALAADLGDAAEEAPDAGPLPMLGPSYGAMGGAAAALALVSLMAVGTLTLRPTSASHDPPRFAAAAGASHGTPVLDDVPPPDLDAKPVAAVVATSAALANPAPAAAHDEPARPAKVRFGRLTVTGTHEVFLDAKRLLGHGPRSFTVVCGAHLISVGTRNDGHEVSLPCNGELVVGK